MTSLLPSQEALLIKKMETIQRFQERSPGSLTLTADVVIISHIFIFFPSVHMMALRPVLALGQMTAEVEPRMDLPSCLMTNFLI